MEKQGEKNRRVIQQLLQSARPIWLELGAGRDRNVPGWTTVDYEDCDLALDLTDPLPFPDGTVDAIYSSHVLEHFSYPHPMNDLLLECRRVLKSGGVMSVCVPDARLYINGYLSPETFDPTPFGIYAPAYHFNSAIDFINYIAYMDGHHHHLFDEENLLAILSKAGFRNARPRTFDPALDTEGRRLESIYAVAEK